MTHLSELDVVFISYDEPNCEKNWAELLNVVPWAKRVHGVKGSDSAHKEAARQSDTARFISVDADNIVYPEFFDQEIDFEHEKFKDKVVSWASINHVNGLRYGNGGLKCWPKQYVLDMKTHENCDPNSSSQIDFCWEDTYVQMNNIYSTTHPNGSPKQMFRSAFREGVKMSLDRGNRVQPDKFEKQIWYGNYIRLMTWMNLGLDVENGLWSLYGARLGCHMTTLTDWDFIQVRDFEYINQFFENEILLRYRHKSRISSESVYCPSDEYYWQYNLLKEHCDELGQVLVRKLGVDIIDINSEQSKYFKKFQQHVPRTGNLVTEEEMNVLLKVNT